MISFPRKVGIQNDERGAAAVEFALISIVLFTILFGIIGFGQLYSQFEVFQSAAREGARVAAVKTTTGGVATDSEIASVVRAAANPYGSKIAASGVESPHVLTPPGPCPATVPTSGARPTVVVAWRQKFNIEIPLIPRLNFFQTIKGVFECEI
jgi:Flp pilus assembly protein TadG